MPTLRELRVQAKWRGLEIKVSCVSGRVQHSIWSPSRRDYLISIFAEGRIAYAALMAALKTMPLTKAGAMSRAMRVIRRDIRDRRRHA